MGSRAVLVKSLGPIMSNFWDPFFHFFRVKKNWFFFFLNILSTALKSYIKWLLYFFFLKKKLKKLELSPQNFRYDVLHLLYSASHTKVYFNEFVANVMHDNIGIVNFDLWGHGDCWRPKTPLGGQKWHEGVDLLKKVFNQSFSTTS